MSFLKTFGLMTALLLVFMLVGSYFGKGGVIMALVLGSAMNFGAYWFSDKIVLKMSKARAVTESEAPKLYHAVSELAVYAGVPMPKVYIIDMPTPNAFATGRNPANAAVAVSPSIVSGLDHDELKGVLAHELSHIKNRDILTATVAATLAGAITYLAHMAQWAALFGGFGGRNNNERGNPLGLLAMIIVAPLAAMLIQLAISRSREFEADASAARLTRQPLSLAGALKKIHSAAKRYPVQIEPATASLYIANPLTGRSMLRWFSTHPPVEERVRRLEELGLKPLG